MEIAKNIETSMRGGIREAAESGGECSTILPTETTFLATSIDTNEWTLDIHAEIAKLPRLDDTPYRSSSTLFLFSFLSHALSLFG